VLIDGIKGLLDDCTCVTRISLLVHDGTPIIERFHSFLTVELSQFVLFSQAFCAIEFVQPYISYTFVFLVKNS